MTGQAAQAPRDDTPSRSPGAWVRVARQSLDLTQEELGKRIGYSRDMIRKVEADERRLSPEATGLLANLLGLAGDERDHFIRAVRGVADGPRVGSLALPPHGAGAAGPLPPNPYPGLLPFREEDAPHFFGREEAVDQVVARVLQHATTVLVGPSGSGKSSLVFAGVVPRLRAQGGWAIVTMRPGRWPFQALGTALVDALEPELTDEARLQEARRLTHMLREGAHGLASLVPSLLGSGETRTLLLILDQAEEVFTLVADPLEAVAFLDRTLPPADAVPPPWRALVTLRADFLTPALERPALGRALQQAAVLVRPMDRAALRRTIEEPARHLGIGFEPGLVDRMLEEQAHSGGAVLPLLQFTLNGLWPLQQQGLLTHAAYDALGGVRNALVSHAEAAIAALPPEAQRRARAVLLQLVQPGDGAADTRRLARRSELAEDDWAVVRHLASARLVVTGYDEQQGSETAELAHDALVTEWPRLRAWLDEDRAFRVWQERLRAQVREWQLSGEDASALLRGPLLMTAETWLQARPGALGPEELRYVQRSLAQRDAERRRSARRRNLVIAALATAATVFLAAAAVAALGWSEAGKLRRVTAARLVAAQSAGHLQGSQDLALLLALEAYSMAPTAEAEGALLNALFYARTVMDYVYPGRQLVHAAAFSPDGRWLATGGTDYLIHLWDLTTFTEAMPPLAGHNAAVIQLRFSPDGRFIASASADRTVRLWDVATRRQLGPPMEGHTREVLALAYSADGRTLVTGGTDRTVRVWDIGTGKEARPPLLGHTDEVLSVSLRRDGTTIASTGFDRTLRVWNLADPDQGAPPLRGHTERAWCAAITPDGQRVVSTGNDGQALVYNLHRRELVRTLSAGPDALLLRCALSPDGRLLAASSGQGPIYLWNLETGELVHPPLIGHGLFSIDVTFSPDGQLLASTGYDGSVILWDVASGAQVQRLVANTEFPGGFHAAHYNSQAQVVVAGAGEGGIGVWEIQSDGAWQMRHHLEGHRGAVHGVATDATGAVAFSGGADGEVRWWDLRRGTLLGAHPEAHRGGVNALGVSPGGGLAATAGRDGTVRFWDMARRAPIGEPVQVSEQPLRAVAFSPDGRLLATAGDGTLLQVWDVETRRPIKSVPTGHDGPVVSLAFSPSGRWLASGGSDARIHVWDAQTFEVSAALASAHLGAVSALTFGANDSRLISGGDDGGVRVWDVPSQQLVGSGFGPTKDDLEVHTGRVTVLAYTAGGWLLSAGADRSIRRWRLNMAEWPQLACGFARRNLTPEEWRRYLPGEPYRKTCTEYP